MTNAGRRRQIVGRAASMASAASSQAGSALSLTLLSTSGGVCWVAITRHVAALAVMLLCGSLRWRRLGTRGLGLACGAGVATATMTVAFYAAAGQQGLTLTALIDILGPLALAATRVRLWVVAVVIPAAMVGIALASGATSITSTASPLGIALALLSAVAWAITIVLNHRLCALPPTMHAFSASALVSCIGVGGMALIARPQPPATGDLALLICVGVLTGAAPLVLDRASLSRITADQYALFVLTQPLWALCAETLLSHRTVHGLQLAGIALTLGAGFALLRARTRP